MIFPLLGSLISSPFLVLALSIALVVVLIGFGRMHAFFALLLAATTVALLTSAGGGGVGAINAVMTELGNSVGGIGFSIAIAAVIGAALTASGAADKIVRTFLRVLGEKGAPVALLAAGYVLSVPVFFDTVFFLLVPLTRALAARTGKNYLMYLLAISAGAIVTHATVPPTPGPLKMVEILGLDLGMVIMIGLVAGIVPAIGALWLARQCDKRMPLELRPVAGSSLEEVREAAHRDESSLPGFFVSIAPVIVPVLLIAGASVAMRVISDEGSSLLVTFKFFGDKNVALFLGALIAVAVYVGQKRTSWRNTAHVAGEPLTTAGAIILITAAGGAYGAMLKQSGIGEVMSTWVSEHHINILLVAWGMSALLRAAQGSTTVAVLTTAGLMASMGGAGGYGVHPVYVYLAIGYGGLFLSWMNDSGFWIFSRMGGLTEGETLRSWTVLVSVVSLLGLIEVLIMAAIYPAVG